MASIRSARLAARVTGVVQGVSYRWFIQRRANELHVVGFVKNNPDDSVSFVAEGPRDSLERLLDFAQAGPPSAMVENVEADWSEPTGEFHRFEIRY